jgi:hypothetical protein
MSNPAYSRQYTYRDYITWEDRYELIEGIPVLMSSSPSERHQSISVRLTIEIGKSLNSLNSPCRVYHAPFDVAFPQKKKRTKILKPLFILSSDGEDF